MRNKSLQKDMKKLKAKIKVLEEELADKPKKIKEKKEDAKAGARKRMQEWREKLK